MLIDRRPNIETNGNNPPRVSLRSSAQADGQTRGGFFVGVVLMEGFVYVLRNPGMPGLLKIGSSTRSPIERAAELFTTGVPYQFEIVCAIYSENCRESESNVHEILHDYRCASNREFFEISEVDAIEFVATECLGHGLTCGIEPLVIKPWLLKDLCQETGMTAICLATLIRYVKPEAWTDASIAMHEQRSSKKKAAENG